MTLDKIVTKNVELKNEVTKPEVINKTFYSQDKNTAVLNFEVTEDGNPVDFNSRPMTAKIAIRTADKSLFYEDAEVSNTITGRVSYTLNSQILMHEGKTSGELFLIENNETASVIRFEFDIKLSLIDSDLSVTETFYVKRFEDLLKQLEGTTSGSGGGITEIPAEYVTETELNAKGYMTTADADRKYALIDHIHSIDGVTDLRATLDGKANANHTHSASEIIMFDGTTVEDKFKNLPTGSVQTDPKTNGLYINANVAFGLVGDGVTDNYDAFHAMANYVNSYGGADIKTMPFYNDGSTIRRAKYRIGRYTIITNIDGTLATDSAKHIRWKKSFNIDFCGAEVVNMPIDGYTRSASFFNDTDKLVYSKEEPIMPFIIEQGINYKISNVIIDGESHKTKYQSGFTSKKFDNPRWSNGYGMETGRGHGINLEGATNGILENVIVTRQQVDGIALSFYSNQTIMEALKSSNITIINSILRGNGRLGISGLGYVNHKLINTITENSGMTQTIDGIWNCFNPAGGVDFEPHQSPISNENTTSTTWKTPFYNGNSSVDGLICRNNACSGISVTSTMLTRNVNFRNTLIEVPADHPGDYPAILMSAQGVTFNGLELRGKTTAGKFSRVVMYSVGGMKDNAGVIGGAAANVFSGITDFQMDGVDFFMNDYGGTVINDIPSGEYGLHNGYIRDGVATDTLFRLKHKRSFVVDNVKVIITPNSPISTFDIYNAYLNNVVLINQKTTPITIGFGSGDYHSEFDRFRVKGAHSFVAGTKQYMVGDIASEEMKQYAYTRSMEYTIKNASGSGTSTTDTTPPNAPTIDTITTNSTVITGTAEANSTVTATFNGVTTATATTNSSGTYSIAKPSNVTLTAGQTVSVVAKDSAGNTSNATTVTIATTPSTSTNLLGVMTNTASTVVNNEANKKVLNSKLSINWNKAQTGITTSSWAIGQDKIEFTNPANDGTTGQTSNDRLMFITFEGLKANTTYTLSYSFLASAFIEGGYYMGNYANPNTTAVNKTITFTTDANGKWGYEFSGSKLFGSAANNYDAAFAYKFGLPVGLKLTFDKMMLNEGSTAQHYTASV